MCYACTGQDANCPLSGKPVDLHVRGEPCPLGMHPVDGVVTCRGIQTYGVPFWVRWWIWARTGVSPSRFAGCGCVKPLKDVWDRLRRAMMLARGKAQGA